MDFRKVHGLGNDFVLVDGLTSSIEEGFFSLERVRAICDRRRGVGADGVLLVLPPRSAGAHARMRVLNADGSEPQMCGNGIRCVARFLHERVVALRGQREILIDTVAGPRACVLELGAGGIFQAVRVDMGQPALDRETLPMEGRGPFIEQPLEVGGGRTVTATAVSMGNPHLVTFVEHVGADLEALARELGPRVERHPLLPERSNVEVARVEGLRIELWVWERGVGITQACGTGACAAAVAAIATSRCTPEIPITVALPGGELTIEVEESLRRVWMTGPAVEVFVGKLAE